MTASASEPRSPAPPIRLIRLHEVKRRTGLSRSTIYRRMGEDRFPRPCHLGERIIAWVEADIDRWLAEIIQECRNGQVNSSVAERSDHSLAIAKIPNR